MPIAAFTDDGGHFIAARFDGPSDSINNLFKDEADKSRYFWPYRPNRSDGVSDLSNTNINAWCLEPEDKRWTAMHCTIDGGKFKYDDLERSRETGDERRKRVLNARYGGKPRVYPPMRAGANRAEALVLIRRRRDGAQHGPT